MATTPVLNLAESPLTSATKSRVSSLVAKFEETFGTKPTFVARAPGRVNLIGEHIDYSGYAVLPMAIEQDFLIAVSTNDSNKLNVANVNPKFTSCEMDAWPIDIDSSSHNWINYFLAGYKGLLEQSGVEAPTGMNAMVDGVVPPGSGLSSSSAFVVCAALAAAFANKKMIPKADLATLCAKAEHYVGTEGGGMDQSISIMAEKGTAKLIQFNPIRATDVALPEGGIFVVSNSCVEAHKYVSAGSCFNKRVVECRAAAQVLAKALKLDNASSFVRLGAVQEAAGVPLEGMEAIVNQHLREGAYTQQEIADILGLSLAELATKVLSPSTVDQQDFYLKMRAQHVYSEASRVWAFKAASTLEEMGNLMNGSHNSCSALYECSCPELDRLTQICRDAGAYGSRLTGAGWGGCAVSLVPQDKVEGFLAKVSAEYYTTPELKEKVATNLFATGAGPGALVIVL
eukprot:m.359901 g.359901  ORF g.359901 m.359901 type:complete len:457 (+) comp18808_c0_seq1:152-1522(+)